MKADEILEQLMWRYPPLKICKTEIIGAFKIIRKAFGTGKKLLIAGNGGSAADSEHIAGELMKSFKLRRRISDNYAAQFEQYYGKEGMALAEKLEGALPAIALPSMSALMTAYMNDNDADAVYAQMVFGCGIEEDVFMAISTSGNSTNIVNACMAAKIKGMQVIGLTGNGGGKLKDLCNVAICVPATETFEIQEYHLPVYHALCAMLEVTFFQE
ncbi:MAG: D-sedoheptulose-7-phosphate isomerase [Eubacteriales bacterium]|jgi:D-sedoheptulose 7-phosphate isomerase